MNSKRPAVRIRDIKAAINEPIFGEHVSARFDPAKRQVILRFSRSNSQAFRVLKAIERLPKYLLRRESPENVLPVIYRVSLSPSRL